MPRPGLDGSKEEADNSVEDKEFPLKSLLHVRRFLAHSNVDTLNKLRNAGCKHVCTPCGGGEGGGRGRGMWVPKVTEILLLFLCTFLFGKWLQSLIHH